VNAAAYRIYDEEAPFAAHHGPGYRAIYDVADWQRSLYIQSSGQSGNILSPHYADFSDAWAHNRYLPMQTNREALAPDALKLTLVPTTLCSSRPQKEERC
jgi:penicillin amidase